MNDLQTSRREVLGMSLAISAWLAVTPALSQSTYPVKSIRFVVPHAPGAITDVLARLLAEPMSKALGQPLVIDNRPGANTAVGGENVARAAGDGYTILMATAAGMAANPAGLMTSARYDTARDFTPISHVGSVSYVVLANPDTGIKTMAQLIAKAREKPGSLKYGSGNLGGMVYMGMLGKGEKLDMINVPYKSTPPAVSDLLGGHLDLMINDLGSSLSLIKSGKVMALAVSGVRRNPVAPDIPTLTETGVKGIREAPGWLGIYGPANMPPAVVEILNRQINAALRLPEVVERATALGIDLQGSTPGALGDYTREQTLLWKDLIAEYQIAPLE